MSDRDELIERLDDVIASAERKTSGPGRLADESKERLRIKYLRTIIQAASAQRLLLKDRDLDDLAERVEALEEANNGESGFQIK
jgi:hypothetical protein